jgi:thermitase
MSNRLIFKRRLLILIAGLLAGLSPVGNAAVPRSMVSPKQARPAYVQGEVLVQFHSDTDPQTRSSFLSAFSTAGARQLPMKNLMLVKLRAGQSVQQAVRDMASDPRIEYAQPNYLYYAQATAPNDTSYGELWALKNIGQTVTGATYATNNPGTAGDDIDAEDAWDHITDCSSVIVAVVDTGINYTQEDLASNMWDGSGAGYPHHGYDYVDNDNDPMPVGGAEEHGTHVAGIIAAEGDNGKGITGVCWKAQIMSVRALDDTGAGTSASISSSINFASNHGAAVINMSLGGGSQDPLISNAITTARNKDVVVVVAAGNGGSDGIGDDNDSGSPTYPCNDTQANLICVAALDQSFSRATFSNYGATSVDVGAPGTNILSTFPGPVFTDDFTGWTMNGGWARASCLFGSGTYDTLVNPSNGCTGGSYADNANDDAYKNFDLSAYSAATVSFFAGYDLGAGDTVSVKYSGSGGDPFPSGTTLTSYSGTTSGVAYLESYNLPGCLTAACTLGFNLTSDGSGTSTGPYFLLFSISTIENNSATYEIENGTSMSTPIVSGIAAMLRAYNPDFTYADTISAIENGGVAASALSGITTSGNAVNAMGSLAYINTPTGLQAKIQ